MSVLRSLHPDAARLVTPELVTGQVDRWPEATFDGLLEDMERDVTLASFDEAVDHVIAQFAPYDAAMDAAAGEAAHRSLSLTRREASQPGIWRFLAVAHRPDFVRHRWENRVFSQSRARFWRMGTRPDSNAFSRLWWVAEMTRDGDDYALTRRVLRRQPLANNIFSRELAWYRPLVEALVDELESEPSAVIEGTLRRLQRRLSTVAAEVLELPTLRQVVHAARLPPPP